MIDLLKNKLIQNASQFRYMYFGIILTILVFLLYKFIVDIIKIIKGKENKKEKIINILKNKYLIGIIITIIPILLEVFLYGNYKISFSKDTYIRFAYIYILYLAIFIYKFITKRKEKVQKVLDFCIKHRYKIALILFIVLVIGQIHFSSIGVWDKYIREGIDSTIIGKPRDIRSDEWLVTTPFNLAQEYNGFKLVNDNVNAGNNDMNIFHAPVLDLSIIVRIFSWGYMLFGNAIGLSWAWGLKIIAMFMINFELGRILTKKDKILSLMTAVVLTFAPVIMWWSMLDVIVLAMAIIVLFHTYMANNEFSLKRKLLIAYGMIVFLCQFAYSLYPAWQIPLAYVMLAFIIVDFIIYRKNLKKKDYIIMIVTILITFLLLGYFVITSWDGIQAMMSTKYPGGREITGGDFDFSTFTNYYTNFFTPYSEDYTNPSEIASFIYPAIAILIIIGIYIVNIIKNKRIKEVLKEKKNWYIFGLIIVSGIFLAWMSFTWPSLLRKITLLYMCQEKRVAIIFEFICVLLTILIAKKIFERKNKILNNKIALLISIIITILTIFIAKQTEYATTFTTFKLVVLATAIFSMNYTLLSSNKKAFAYTMIIISLIAGIYVNPVSSGIDVITETELAKTAVNIAKEDKEACWIGGSQINAQYLIANGIKALNGINQYPNYDWVEKLDPEHKYEEVWNRYAHIAIKLGEETNFELLTTDSYRLTLNYEDLKDLDIKYYYTNEKANEKKQEEFSLETLYENDYTGQYIYKIN